MQAHLREQINSAITQLQQQGKLPADLPLDIQIEYARDNKHGDFACNIALILAKVAKSNPRALATAIVAALPGSALIANVELAGPGFINFFMTDVAWQQVVKEILAARSSFGTSKTHAGQRIHMEYVSSNPTGPLHVGHGRSAAYGASLANLLEAVGYDVHREYYVNDAGRQMQILATSIWLRYLQAHQVDIRFPQNGYVGDYVNHMAEQLSEQVGKSLLHPITEVLQDVPADESEGGNKDQHIDALISNAKRLLGDAFQTIFKLGLETMLRDIETDLEEFHVHYDEWFSEQSLFDNGAMTHALNVLREKGYLYEKEEALWFKSSELGDDKDRVLRRSNGQYTYFTPDIAYHLTKLERGNTKIIDVLGADHHGYVQRMRAAIKALTDKDDVLIVPLLQFVSLYRGTTKIPMSTRGGQFVTLRELREEVGNDAARFFYVMRKADQTMDFDLELAKSKSNENPVYYIQYAHARVCSVLRQLSEKGIAWTVGEGIEKLSQLTDEIERGLFKKLLRYPEIIENAANNHEPSLLANYLRELAAEFHRYYNHSQFIIDDVNLRNARLNLISAIKQVIENGLALLGVSAPEKM